METYRGQPTGNGITTFGKYYDTATRERIRNRAHEFRNQGLNMTQIAEKLTQENFRSPRGRILNASQTYQIVMAKQKRKKYSRRKVTPKTTMIEVNKLMVIKNLVEVVGLSREEKKSLAIEWLVQ